MHEGKTLNIWDWPEYFLSLVLSLIGIYYVSNSQTLKQHVSSSAEHEEISLADLEGSHNEILKRVVKRVRQGDTITGHGSHNSHGSSHHTSS